MPRVTPPGRLDALAAAATTVFSARGYRRTQMAEVARVLELAPGTLYASVEGKAALFDLALRRALGVPLGAPPRPTPAPGETAAWVRARLDFRDFPALTAAAVGGGDARAVVAELYDVLHEVADGVALLEASATDLPELGEILDAVRAELLRRLTAFLDAQPAPVALDAGVAARFVLDATAAFALTRRRDRTGVIPEDAARTTAIALLAAALQSDRAREGR
jgi:AcrR family transcriptional regulator